MAVESKERVDHRPRAERAEEAAASPCPHCDHRPVNRNFLTGMWSCLNCSAGGFLMWDSNGWAIRDTAVPMPLTLEGSR